MLVSNILHYQAGRILAQATDGSLCWARPHEHLADKTGFQILRHAVVNHQEYRWNPWPVGEPQDIPEIVSNLLENARKEHSFPIKTLTPV
jgi:hypothetical protein